MKKKKITQVFERAISFLNKDLYNINYYKL
mgnify:CR=1 FL=1